MRGKRSDWPIVIDSVITGATDSRRHVVGGGKSFSIIDPAREAFQKPVPAVAAIAAIAANKNPNVIAARRSTDGYALVRHETACGRPAESLSFSRRTF